MEIIVEALLFRKSSDMKFLKTIFKERLVC